MEAGGAVKVSAGGTVSQVEGDGQHGARFKGGRGEVELPAKDATTITRAFLSLLLAIEFSEKVHREGLRWMLAANRMRGTQMRAHA